MVCVFVLTVSLNDVKNVTTPQLVLFIAPYSVAAYSSRGRALLGLGICVTAIAAGNLFGTGTSASRRGCSASAPPPGRRG